MIRKILSREEIEKKDRKNKMIMSIVLALIMLLSTAGYFVMDFSGQKVKPVIYNGVEFKQGDYGYWEFIVNGQAFSTFYTPAETENISAAITKNIGSYMNQPLYFSAEPIEEMPNTQEIVRNIGSLASRNNYACLEEDCSQDYAVKNCSLDNIIIYQESKENQTKITQEDNCIRILYAEGEAEKASDAFIFKILGL